MGALAAGNVVVNRRGFLGALLAGAVLDPERLLWQPGAKTISIPAAPAALAYLEAGHVFFALGDVVTIQGFPVRLVVTKLGGNGGVVGTEFRPEGFSGANLAC